MTCPDPFQCPACHQWFATEITARQHRPVIVCRDPAAAGLTFDGRRRLWTWPGPTTIGQVTG